MVAARFSACACVRAHNAELPHVLVPRAGPAYAAISQVQPKQVRVVARGSGGVGPGAHLGQTARGLALTGCSRQSCNVAREMPVDRLMLRILIPRPMSATAWRRTSALYIITVSQAALTILRMQNCLLGAPGGIRTHTLRVLNPHALPVGVPGPQLAVWE